MAEQELEAQRTVITSTSSSEYCSIKGVSVLFVFTFLQRFSTPRHVIPCFITDLLYDSVLYKRHDPNIYINIYVLM